MEKKDQKIKISACRPKKMLPILVALQALWLSAKASADTGPNGTKACTFKHIPKRKHPSLKNVILKIEYLQRWSCYNATML